MHFPRSPGHFRLPVCSPVFSQAVLNGQAEGVHAHMDPERRQQIATVRRALLWGHSGPRAAHSGPLPSVRSWWLQPPFRGAQTPPAAARPAHSQGVLHFTRQHAASALRSETGDFVSDVFSTACRSALVLLPQGGPGRKQGREARALHGDLEHESSSRFSLLSAPPAMGVVSVSAGCSATCGVLESTEGPCAGAAACLPPSRPAPTH